MSEQPYAVMLTEKENEAARVALAFILAGEFEETVGDNPGFTKEQAKRALAKLSNAADRASGKGGRS